MFRFGKMSKKHLSTCHIDIQTICNEAIKYFDFSVICGYRGREAQNEAYRRGFSKVVYPNGKHNQNPSMAVDIMPYPKDWDDKERFILLAGFMIAVAEMLYKDGEVTHVLRWGGDWDSDRMLNDHVFRDFPHFELVKKSEFD